MYIATFGHYDELIIVVEHIISVEGLAETRGGHPVPGPDGKPKFTASMIGLDNGTSLQVPHTPREVAQRRREAIAHKVMVPPS